MDNKQQIGTATGKDMGTQDGIWAMRLKVTAITSIYTGENKKKDAENRKDGKLLPTRKSGDGYATVNLAGIVRFYAEKIYKIDGACDVGVNAKGCGRCLTCDMFGSLGRKGRISVDELKSVVPFGQCVDICTHPRISRETGTVVQDRGATIDLEEVREGTVFLGNIMIRNPKEKDVEMLSSILKAIEENGLGGWTRRGKGRCSFAVTLDKIGWQNYKDMGKEEARKLLNPEKKSAQPVATK
jgi:hypothetical protein